MSKHLLVVSNDLHINSELCTHLKSEGYIIHSARTADEALIRLPEHLPDLVLLDLDLPQWSAWPVLAQLVHFQPRIPVVITSAGGFSIEEGLCSGADRGLLKPVDLPFARRLFSQVVTQQA